MKSGLRSAVVASLLALGVGTLATVAVERDAQASVSIAILLDELVRDSSAAAMVTPVEQKSVWEDGRIYTYTRVHVDRAVAGGGTAGDEMWVRTLGGTVGRIGQLVDGEAVLTVGRPSLLFVKPAADVQGIFLVTGRAQGQFPVVLDETTKAPLLIHAGSAGALVPPTTARVLEVTKLRALAGLPSAPRLAAEALHKCPVEDALGEIAASWARLHAAP